MAKRRSSRRSRSTRKVSRSKRGRASRRSRGVPLRKQILSILVRRDAIATDIARKIGAGKAVTYQVLERLQREGKIKTRGTVKGKRGRAAVYSLVAPLAPGSKPVRVSLKVDRAEGLSTRVLLRAIGEAIGGEATLVRGPGGRAGKGLYLQLTIE